MGWHVEQHARTVTAVRYQNCLVLDTAVSEREQGPTVSFRTSSRGEHGYARRRSSQIRKENSMSGIGALLGLAVLAIIVRTAGWSHGRGDRLNLGFVSERWLAEQRLSQSQDHK
jgi:hypothetical protein